MEKSPEDAARDSNLARIRALMAKTVGNGCTEAEAKSAAAAVDRLLALYEIDLDDVTIKQQEVVTLHVKNTDHPVSYSSSAIAGFTDCRCWTSNKNIVYFGFKVDTEIAEYLTLVFQRAIDRETGNFLVFNMDYEEASTKAKSDMIYSFKVGMAVRLGERLRELKDKRDFAQRTTGRDLVLMKKPVIDEAFAGLNIKWGYGKAARGINDTAAFGAGKSAAESVSIHQGIAGRASRNAGRLK